MDLFCFGCGEHIGALPNSKTSCQCLMDSLSQLSLKPTEETTIDLTLHYPPNYGLLTQNGDQMIMLTEDMDIVYTLYADCNSVIDL